MLGASEGRRLDPEKLWRRAIPLGLLKFLPGGFLRFGLLCRLQFRAGIGCVSSASLSLSPDQSWQNILAGVPGIPAAVSGSGLGSKPGKGDACRWDGQGAACPFLESTSAL